jgi:translation initiation factor 4E
MPYGTNLHLFQKGIHPVWEDPVFENGCWLCLKSQKFQSSKYWEDMLLAMLGEQFEAADFVVGMVLKLRPQFDKIDVWMRDSR